MDTTTFMQRVLPAAGNIVICALKPAKPKDIFWNHSNCSTVAEATAAVSAVDSSKNLTAYFAVGTHTNNSAANASGKPKIKRTKATAAYFKSLALDLDCGAGKPYPTKRDGLAARAKVGYLPSELGLYGDMTGRDTLRLFARLNQNPVDPRYLGELQERLQLPDSDLRRKVREYSSGMKRKLGILQALQNDPPLLIMDEPTEGLDPLMQDSFYDLLHSLQQRGRTIFFSSHVLSEVERVCQRVALMRRGELVLLASVEEARKLAPREVRVTFRANVPAPAGPWEVVRAEPQRWHLKVQGPLAPLLQDLAALPADDMEVSEAKLEDAVRGFYRGDAA